MKNYTAAIWIALAFFAASASRAETVVVSADRMLDVISGRMVEHPLITITDGRITSVASQGASAAANVHRVDLPGMTLLPGSSTCTC